MNQYEPSLIAMKRLLDVVGESHWVQWSETGITKWRSKRDVTHHLSAYLCLRWNGIIQWRWILKTNQHTVTESQEPWANALFEYL